jgi:putative two-component system response regulator
VFQLLDAWDALTNERPYKKALTAADALELLATETQEGRWDPQFFGLFETWKRETANA